MYTLHPPSVTDKRFPKAPSIEPKTVVGPHPVRAVGPGRLERSYQTQVARLSRELQAVQQAQGYADRELETARLVERGTKRLVDRLEDQVSHREAKARRALVLVGSLQHDNQVLQAKIDRLEHRLQRLAAPQQLSLAQRFWSRFSIGRQAHA